jgi:hypothetical protein
MKKTPPHKGVAEPTELKIDARIWPERLAEPATLADSGSKSSGGHAPRSRNTRFKKGQTGNPRGRPKGRRNLRTVVVSELNKRISIRQGDKVRAATKQEALIITLVDGALKRDPKATVALLSLLRGLGILNDSPEPTSAEPVTANDAEIIADFLRRHAASTEKSNGPENSISDRQNASANKGANS